jgi:hypothetical protein
VLALTEVGENEDDVEDITCVSPNVMNEEGGGELRAEFSGFCSC